MRFAAVLAISLLGVSTALGQSAPTASAQPATGSQAASAEAPPVHPITPEQVHEILELTHAKVIEHQVMQSMLINFEKVFPPYMPKDVIADIERTLEETDFEVMTRRAYQKHISSEDAAQVIAFYKSPAGQRFLAAMPAVTRDIQMSSVGIGERDVEQVLHAHMDEIKAAQKKYMQEHSGQPKIITPN